jgi:hypothetical protein
VSSQRQHISTGSPFEPESGYLASGAQSES